MEMPCHLKQLGSRFLGLESDSDFVVSWLFQGLCEGVFKGYTSLEEYYELSGEQGGLGKSERKL